MVYLCTDLIAAPGGGGPDHASGDCLV